MNELGPSWLFESDDEVSWVLADGGILFVNALGTVMNTAPFLAAARQARTLSLPLESKIVFSPVCPLEALAVSGDPAPPLPDEGFACCGVAASRFAAGPPSDDVLDPSEL